MKKKIFGLLCSVLMLTTALTGCGGASASSPAPNESEEGSLQNEHNNTVSPDLSVVNLTADITASEDGTEEDTASLPTDTAAAADFGLRLLQHSAKEGENTLISPLSVLYALGMTSNGAENNTLSQMEEAFGMSRQELNAYLSAYGQSLPTEDKCRLSLANSIWINNDIDPEVREEFLQSAVNWYDSEVYRASFDDAALAAINDWVKENTDGMIPDILNELPEDTVLCLINALAFDAEWENIYRENEIQDGTFTAADGTEQTVDMMYSDETLYLKDEHAVGFIKYYAGEDFAFAALLPEEGMSVSDYMSSLTGQRLLEVLNNPLETKVHASMPKFQCEYSVEMNDILKSMGMTDAFDPQAADFSSMGSTGELPFYIDRVIHKTYIAVDEKGTKAGAATAVMIAEMSLELPESETVYLDRPFVYMLIDCRHGNLPVFIGTLEHIENE